MYGLFASAALTAAPAPGCKKLRLPGTSCPMELCQSHCTAKKRQTVVFGKIGISLHPIQEGKPTPKALLFLQLQGASLETESSDMLRKVLSKP